MSALLQAVPEHGVFLAPINPEKVTTIVETFDLACQRYAQRPAFTSLGCTLSYADLELLSRQFAAYLQHDLGLVPGDRVAVQLPNLVQYPVVVFGAMRAGLVIVNTNPLYTAREIEHQLRDSGAKALVVLANMASVAARVIDNTAVQQVIVTEVADLHKPLKRTLINGVVRHVKKQVPEYKIAGALSFRQALQRGKSLTLRPHSPTHTDLAALQYTGGTTGVAKGAMLSHGNLVANALQVEAHLGHWLAEKDELFIGPLPLYHIYAFTLHCMVLLSRGAHSVLIPNPRDMSAFVKELRRWPFSGFAGLNTLFVALCRDSGFRQLDFSRLKFTASGGMALTREAARQWQEITGCEILEGYGLTETSPAVTFNQPDCLRLGCVGRAVPLTELRICDEMDGELAQGLTGELQVRGPQVMAGYWQRPAETAQVLTDDGWLRTGDIALIHDDGQVQIVDRKKDMVVVSGFNVYPNEIEDLVCTMPGVRECAAIGVADPRTGEAVKLFVVADDAALSPESIRAFCRSAMTAYKVPRYIDFCDDLPKSNVGKVLRRALKAQEQTP